MRLRSTTALCIVAVGLLVRCGGSSTPLPSGANAAPAATTRGVRVLSGESGRPVTGAKVLFGGAEFPTDASGAATLRGATLAAGPLDVLAPEFLDRQTLLERADASGQVMLWPRTSTSGITETFTREVLYTDAGLGSDATAGGAPLRRWRRGLERIDVVLLGPDDNPAYRELPGPAPAVINRAVTELNAALSGALVYGPPHLGDDVDVPGTVRVRFFPEYSYCVNSDSWALTLVSAIDIQSATVTFCARDAAMDFRTVLHELGHTLGFHHSTDSRDVMSTGNRTLETFSARERVTMRLMLLRSAGNRFPDNDRTLSLLTRSAPRPIACR